MKEQWVENIMQSIDNLKEVEISDELNERILRQIPAAKAQFVVLTKPTKWTMIACLVLLIGLNSFTIVNYARVRHINKEDVLAKNRFYEEYFSAPIEY